MIFKCSDLFFISVIFCRLFIPETTSLYAEVKSMVPEVVSKIHHDRRAFTQGLGYIDNKLYESTGLHGESTLRQLDISTGDVLKKHLLPSEFFGEGLAVFPEQIIQITWRQKRALIYDRASLQQIGILDYKGEGWGLCRDGDTVWMSNGSSRLTQRDAKSFKILKRLRVKMNEAPVNLLNDLECVQDHIYANIWMSDKIIRIEKASGRVDILIDTSALLSPEEKKRLGQDDVLNGIAFHPLRGTFFITGKRWPYIYEVRFIDATGKDQ